MAGIIGTVAVKVSTEVMVAQAEEVRTLGNSMKQKLSNILDIASRTKFYWTGEAGELHRKLFESQRSDIDIMIRRLLEHSNDLLAIAQNYEAGEATNVETALQLQADIIQ